MNGFPYSFLVSVTMLTLLMIICIMICFIFRKRITSQYLACAAVSISWWLLCYVIALTLEAPSLKLLFFKLRLIGVYFSSPLYLLFTLCYNKKMHMAHIGRKLFFLLPTIMLILTATNSAHHLIYKSLTIADNQFLYSFGFFYYIYLFYSNALIIYANYVILAHMRETKASKWNLSMFVAFSILFVVAVGFSGYIQVTRGGSGAYDASVLGIFAIGYTYFNYYFITGSFDKALKAKDAVFNNLSTASIIMDKDRSIIKANKKAEGLFGVSERDYTGVCFDDFLKDWSQKHSEECKESIGHSEADYSDVIAVMQNGEFEYYKIVETPLDEEGINDVFGFVELINITKEHMLITELFRLVNTDKLTGKFNRRYFDEVCDQYDTQGKLPLAIIFGDLNKLKQVNDNYGHDMGDKYINIAAGILERAADSKEAIICRIGGDEFAVVVPNAAEERILQYISEVERICEEISKQRLVNISVSISLGYAIKNTLDENIEAIIKHADNHMYEMKRDRYSNR